MFAASATLASDSFQLTNDQKEKYCHGKTFYRSDYGVLLSEIQIWKTAHFVEDLVPNLKFIENKESWFAYFQGGVRQVSEDDFRTITEGRELTLIELNCIRFTVLLTKNLSFNSSQNGGVVCRDVRRNARESTAFETISKRKQNV